ncbi:Os09g0311351 [Oryza sativa Japonica Group]|uniref:Os09g0311351 protein n=1 Tax=Oryza sativa subsp. japonica TaxID=39947 RepID=A0A0P0XL21_ORYSJ|nr:Os09g0311351 [Oryza sativa Japonica Group]
MKGLREHRGQVDLVNGSQNQRMHEVVYYISSGKMRGIVQRANVPSVSLTECSTDEDVYNEHWLALPTSLEEPYEAKASRSVLKLSLSSNGASSPRSPGDLGTAAVSRDLAQRRGTTMLARWLRKTTTRRTE